MQTEWKNFVTSNRKLIPGDPDYRKLYLTNALLLTAMVVFALFSLITFFATGQYIVGLIDLTGVAVALQSIRYLRNGGRLIVASSVLVGMVFILTLLSIYVDTYPNMNLAWIFVMPLTAIFLLDHKWGVRVVVLYALIYFVILWLRSDSVEFVNKGPLLAANLLGVLVVVTLLSRYFDISRKEAYESLEEALKREATQSLKLKKALDEISLYKHDLEMKVAETVDELRKKDKLLIQQSKMASMGEMIAIIAHQLKQPINAIALVTQDAKEAYTSHELDEVYINELSTRTMNNLMFMSATIDGFRNFLNPHKKREWFWLKESVHKAVDIIRPQLKADEVTVYIEGEDAKLYGLSSEIQQMVINLVINAKEAMKSQQVKERAIIITITKEKGKVKLKVRDTGGGIDEGILHSLFSSYTTSKGESGTGLGLYMVKLIAEGMQGSVEAYNTEGGAEFTITLPLNEV